MRRLVIVSAVIGVLVLPSSTTDARKPAGAGRARTTTTTTTTTTPPPIVTTTSDTGIQFDGQSTGTTSTTVQSGIVTENPEAGFHVSMEPSFGTSGWALETSDPRESIEHLGSSVACTVGGFEAPTHFARARRKLPETDDFAARSSFSVAAEIELPTDFYERNESYVRFITTDNYPAKMRSTGATVGAASSDEWRVGFLMYNGDKLPRLQSDHEGRGTLTLWQGDRPLPVGKNRVEIHFTPSQSNAGSYSVILNGRIVAQQSGVQTVPSTLAASEVVVTRVGGCLDGAANQRSKSMSVLLHSLTFSAEL
jgi:hypothetical protein